VLVDGALGFTKRDFFEVEDAADREVPVVSFDTGAQGAQAAPPSPAPSSPASPAGDAPTTPSS